MKTLRMAAVWAIATAVCTAATSAAAAADEAKEPTRAYYKKGDVGAFAATMPIPPDLDLTATLFARTTDDKVYMLFVASPLTMIDRLDAARKYHRNDYDYSLTPAQQRKVTDLQSKSSEQWKKINRPEWYTTQQKVAGLKAVLEAEEAKKENQDAALVARTKDAIADLEAKMKGWKAESDAAYKQIQTIQEEINKIYAERRAATPEEEREALPPIVVFGRFQGAGKATVAVFARGPDKLLADPRLVGTVEVDLPAADGGEENVLKGWATAQAKEYALRVLDSPYSSFYQYCLLRSVEKRLVDKDEIPRQIREEARDPERRPDLYSVTTGALAIQESLQLDAMTRDRAIPKEWDVALDTLKGPEIKSHPFEKMLEGRTPKTFAVDALVPYDAYYCHFTSVSKEIATSDLLNQWGTSLLRMMTVEARDLDITPRYQEQLCVGVSVLTRLFGDVVIGEMALTGSDPFMSEGTDLSVIIQVRSRAPFEKQMKGYLDAALVDHRDATVATSTYEGVEIQSVTTPDGVVSSHSAWLGEYKAYSNSVGALKRIIDTQARRRTSMAENMDYRYMRTIFPGTAQDEDGFIYFSDAFIRKIVGPRWKISEQRRMVCQANLRMVTNGSALYRMEMRKKGDMATLAKAEYLPDISCPDGGTYSVDAAGRAVCSVHNRLRWCTPVDSIPLDKVSQSEADDYKRFMQNYNNYWRQYFDPIGIRFKVGDRVEVETCILPLIENTVYNQVREVVGGKPVELKARVLTDRTLGGLTMKFDLTKPEHKEMLKEMQAALPPSFPPIEKCVGSSLSLNLVDSDVVFTVDEAGFGEFGWRMNVGEQLMIGTILSALSLPMYGVLELKDEKMAETAMRELVKMAEAASKMEGRRRGEDWFGLERYDAGKRNGHELQAVVLRLAVMRFRLYYAIAHERLVVATKRYVLEDALDALDKDAKGGEATGNVQLDVRPRAFEKLLPVVKVGWQEQMRRACEKNLVAVRALIECNGATEANLDEVSRRIEGVTMRCPAGGAYKYDPVRDLVYCTAHGDRAHPTQPVEAVGGEEFMQFVKRLKEFSVNFRFTDEGIMTKVVLDMEPQNK